METTMNQTTAVREEGIAAIPPPGGLSESDIETQQQQQQNVDSDEQWGSRLEDLERDFRVHGIAGESLSRVLLRIDLEALTLDELDACKAQLAEQLERIEKEKRSAVPGRGPELDSHVVEYVEERIRKLEERRVRSIIRRLKGAAQGSVSQSPSLPYRAVLGPRDSVQVAKMDLLSGGEGEGVESQTLGASVDGQIVECEGNEKSDASWVTTPSEQLSSGTGLGPHIAATSSSLPALHPAELDHRQVQYALGHMYRRGCAVPVDHTNSAAWYRKSAEQGYAPAQFMLARCLWQGQGLPKNVHEAFAWFQKSAEQGNPRAAYRLGVCFRTGRGTRKNLREAFRWFLQSALRGHCRGQRDVAICFHYGRGVGKDLREAFVWYGKAAEQGSSRSQALLAYLYLTGKGVAKDCAKGVEWARKAAENGDDWAHNLLGVCHMWGLGVPMDFEEGMERYRTSAALGCSVARLTIALCKAWGALPRFVRKPLKPLIKAAEPKRRALLPNRKGGSGSLVLY
eukprot:TRINITY_DN916_c0_g6_i1.p1 TRINITY_DN916_c0_g6~~TRINITY_DN916_c0_g6_i1.p1  ORF type:complete len:512 (+),score=43.18 TRINITY_DN916_c0_g6_i1:159-1694(+)